MWVKSHFIQYGNNRKGYEMKSGALALISMMLDLSRRVQVASCHDDALYFHTISQNKPSS